MSFWLSLMLASWVHASTVQMQPMQFEQVLQAAELVAVGKASGPQVQKYPVAVHGSKRKTEVRIPVYTVEIEEVLFGDTKVSGKIRVISPADIVLKQFGNAQVVSYVQPSYASKVDLKKAVAAKDSLVFFLSLVRSSDPDLQGMWSFVAQGSYESKARLGEIKTELQKKRESSP
jgi:hypothetical protein